MSSKRKQFSFDELQNKRRRLFQKSGDAAIQAILQPLKLLKQARVTKTPTETRRSKKAAVPVTGYGRNSHGLLILPSKFCAPRTLVNEILQEMPPLCFFNFVLTAKVIWAGELPSDGKDLPVRGISWSMGGCNSRGKHGHHVQANYVEAVNDVAVGRSKGEWVGRCPDALTTRLFPRFQPLDRIDDTGKVVSRAKAPNPQVTVSIFLRYILNTVGAPTRAHAVYALRAARLELQRSMKQRGAVFLGDIKLDNIQAVMYLFPAGDTTSYIDVDKLSRCDSSVIYEPDVISRALMPWIRVDDTHMVRFTVHASGKCVMLGGKTYEICQKARDIMSRFLCHFVVRAPLGCAPRHPDSEN